MTINDLRVLVSNLDEYIHIPGGIDRLRKTVLHLAVSGQLVAQDPSEGTGEDLYKQVQELYKPKKPLLEITESEILFDIPTSWLWVRLGNVSDSNIGLTYSPGDVGSRGTAVLRSNNIQNGKMNYHELVFVKSDVPESKMAHIGDLLICARNGSHRLVGKNALVDEEGMCFGAFMALLRSDFTRFIKLFLDSPEFRRNLDGIQTTTINQITQGLLNNFVLPLPPNAEQERIVERVEEIFALIDELDVKHKAEEAERSKLVKSSLRALSDQGSHLALENLTNIIKTKADAAELRKAILHLAVSGQLVPQIESEGTAEELYQLIHTELSDSKKRKELPEITPEEILFSIPNNWRWTRLGELFDITSSKRVMQADWKSSGVPFLRARDLTNATKTGYMESDIFVSEKYYNETAINSGVPLAGDIMVTGVGTVGTPYTVKDGDKFYFKDATILWFRNPANVFVDYVEMVFHAGFMKDIIMGQSQGTTVNTYTIANARLNMIPLPPLAEQKRIVTKTTELLKLVSELEKNLEK